MQAPTPVHLILTQPLSIQMSFWTWLPVEGHCLITSVVTAAGSTVVTVVGFSVDVTQSPVQVDISQLGRLPLFVHLQIRWIPTLENLVFTCRSLLHYHRFSSGCKSSSDHILTCQFYMLEYWLWSCLFLPHMSK